MLGISTACMPGFSSNLADFFEKSIEMGFGAFEVGVSSAEISREDILDWQRRLNSNVVSVHNLFAGRSIEPENRRGDFLASPDEMKRQETIKLTLETAGLAKELGAKAVILHVGYIEEKCLRDSCQDFKEEWCRRKESRPLEVWRNSANEMRARHASDYVERVVRSLRTLCRMDNETLFCLEPRVNFYEIPSLKEMEEIFDRVRECNLRYWHDTGHCQVQENMGFSTQEEWLSAFSRRMVGIHLHDVRWLEDHFPPGTGDVDFSLVRKYLREETIKIVEVRSGTTEHELEKSLIFLGRTSLA